MTRVSDRFLQLAVVLALVGMGLGIGMGISQNFQLQPVHAHINLLGWVSMTLYGLVYRVVPKAAEGRLPVVHFWLGAVSSVAMMALLAVEASGLASIVPVLGVAALGVWLSVALFAVIVFRATWRA
jgi:cbb3-type cytochrome oxidase subunit 1